MLSRPRRASASHPINYSEASYTPGPLAICPSYHTPSSSTSTALVVRRPKAAARTGGKTFQCVGYGECEMKFTRSEHLARHIRKHTGEKPFVCHCSKAFSRIDNLRQHCASVHSNLVKLNEVTIRALMPVHSALSQQAGRDNQAYVRYIGTKSPKPTLRLTDRRISSMRGTRSITPPALYSLPPTPVSAMTHNKNIRIQDYEESTPGGTYASPMGYPGHNDSELKYRSITWRGNDSMIPSIIRHGFQTPVSAGSAVLKELSKECTEADEEEEENGEGGRVYSYESEDSGSSHSDDADGTDPTSASSSKMDTKQNIAYPENPAFLLASQIRPRHPPFLQQRSFSSPDIFTSVSGSGDFHTAPALHPVQQQHRHSIAQCSPDFQDHRYVQGAHSHVSHSVEDAHSPALSQYAGLAQGPQGGYNLYRSDTQSHVKTGFSHKAEPSRDGSRQVAEDYQSYDFGHSYNYTPDFHQGGQPGVSDSPHAFGEQGLWGFSHNTNNAHQTSVSTDQYIHPNHPLHHQQHYQSQQHSSTAWRSTTAMAHTPWGRDHGRTRMNQVQPSYAPHTSAGPITSATNNANVGQPNPATGYYPQPSLYTGPRHPPSKSKNSAIVRPEPGLSHHPLHTSSNQGNLSSAAGFPSHQPNRNLTMVPSTTLSSLYSPPFPILRTLSPTNHESGPRASASEEQPSAISGKKRSVSPPDGGHYTLENEGYTYGDEDGHSGSNGNKRLRLFSEAVEIENPSYHLANYQNQDDQASHPNPTQANLNIVSSTNSTGNTVPTFNSDSSHAPPEEAATSSREMIVNESNPSAFPASSEGSSNHRPRGEPALSQAAEAKTDGLVVSLSDLANSVFVKQEIEDRFPEEEEPWAVITSNEDASRESNQEHFQSGHTDMSDFLGDSFK